MSFFEAFICIYLLIIILSPGALGRWLAKVMKSYLESFKL